MKYYTPKLFEAFHKIKKPAPVDIELAEVDKGLIIYCNEAQLAKLEEDDPQQFGFFCEYIFDLIKVAERFGVECITIKKPM